MARLRNTMMLLALAGLAACSGAAIGPGNNGRDSDGDGLTDVEEAAIGSNPDAADTDRDGWNDGDELLNNTDPLNGFDYPYTGGWPIAACRNDPEPSGNRVGQVAESFSLMDQHGDPVRLHDFCDRKVIMASSAVWCIPCQEEALLLQRMYEEYADDGLMVITLLGEDTEFNTPSLAILQEWVSEFDLTTPVLQDTSFSVTLSYSATAQVGLPSTQFIAEGAVVEATQLTDFDEDDVRSFLGLD